MFRGYIDRGIGRAAKPYREAPLHGLEAKLRPLHLDVIAIEIDLLAGHQAIEHGQEFRRMRVTLVMRQKDTVSREFCGVAAGHDIDDETAIADSVDRRRLTREIGWRSVTRP